MNSATAVRSVRVWDWSVRLFHWSLLLAVIALIVSGYLGEMQLHFLAGEIGLVLVAFRLVWGVIGSQTARFSDFLVGPAGIWTYLRTGKARTPGHNPLGGLMVVAMLVALLGQVVSGLLATGDGMEGGPLAHLLTATASLRAFGLHQKLAIVLLGMIALHVAAVVFHWLVHKDNLVLPMLTGWKRIPGQVADVSFVSAARALFAWGLISGIVLATVTLL